MSANHNGHLNLHKLMCRYTWLSSLRLEFHLIESGLVQRTDCKNVIVSLFCLTAYELCLCNRAYMFRGFYLVPPSFRPTEITKVSSLLMARIFFQKTGCKTRCNVSRCLIIHLWLYALQSTLSFGFTVLGIERSEQSKLFCLCCINFCAEKVLEMQVISYAKVTKYSH